MRLGLILIAIAAVISIPVWDEDVNREIARNAECNGRQCTEDETRTIAGIASGILALAGSVLLIRGVATAIRGRDSTAVEMLARSRSGAIDPDAERMDRLAELDARYARGNMPNDEYMAERERILGAF